MPPTASIKVDARAYLAIAKAERVNDVLSLALSSHAYLPRIEDLESDWVAHVAAPAFKLFRENRGDLPVESFCSIGTGSGLDVLAGIELLGASRVGLTDVHQDVVSTAADNVARNLRVSSAVAIEQGFGDLLKPLLKFNARYDVIYENLPNVPIDNEIEVAQGRKSSAFLAPRREPVPGPIHHNMLDLHYLALVEARDFLKPDGVVLSTIGGRIPLGGILELGRLAGFSVSFQVFTWKTQADAEDVIAGHAQKQREGFGPFFFYKTAVLKRVFKDADPASTGENALAIEKQLEPERLDAVSALAALRNGETIGHTVAVLKSELQ